MHRGDRALTKAHVAEGKNAAISSSNHRLEHVSHSTRADLSLGRNPVGIRQVSEPKGYGQCLLLHL